MADDSHDLWKRFWKQFLLTLFLLAIIICEYFLERQSIEECTFKENREKIDCEENYLLLKVFFAIFGLFLHVLISLVAWATSSCCCCCLDKYEATCMRVVDKFERKKSQKEQVEVGGESQEPLTGTSNIV